MLLDNELLITSLSDAVNYEWGSEKTIELIALFILGGSLLTLIGLNVIPNKGGRK